MKSVVRHVICNLFPSKKSSATVEGGKIMSEKNNEIMIACILIFLSFLIVCPAGKADQLTLEDVTMINDDSYTCTFDGVKHSFLLELPEASKGAPLVLMLPGYGNTAEAFRARTHFEEPANTLGYAVVYVTGAPDPYSSTSAIGWHSENDTPGNRDVEFLVAIADYLQEAYSLDHEHAYIVGYSNGAFMTHRLAMEAGETFSAFVSVAGLMPESVWNTRKESNAISFFQITGEKDPVIPKKSDGSAQFSKAPAIEDVMAYWVSSVGLQLLETEQIGNASVLMKYGIDGKPYQIWDLYVTGGRHSWPDKIFNQIDINSLILEFFEAQK